MLIVRNIDDCRTLTIEICICAV